MKRGSFAASFLTAVTESDESDAAKILELLKNPETAALLKQLAKAL